MVDRKMTYINKKTKRLKKKIKKITSEGDQNKHPYDVMLQRLSRGGKLERSYKKRVGNIINKSADRYNITLKALKKIGRK